MTGELSLFFMGNALPAPTECAEALLSLNELTQSRGLVLSPEQALALEQSRAAALEETGRLEMGQGILPELIYAFYDSPFLSPETYSETLNALTALFYRGKTAAREAVSDEALLKFLRREFDGACRGSLELLEDALEEWTAKLRGRIAPHLGKEARPDDL